MVVITVLSNTSSLKVSALRESADSSISQSRHCLDAYTSDSESAHLSQRKFEPSVRSIRLYSARQHVGCVQTITWLSTWQHLRIMPQLTATTFGQLIHFLYIKELYMEGSRPEWCISSMIYRRGIPFWSEPLEYYVLKKQQGC